MDVESKRQKKRETKTIKKWENCSTSACTRTTVVEKNTNKTINAPNLKLTDVVHKDKNQQTHRSRRIIIYIEVQSGLLRPKSNHHNNAVHNSGFART